MSNDINYIVARGDGSLPPVRCPRCGELNSAKARLCSVCGAAMPEIVVATDGDPETWQEWDEIEDGEAENDDVPTELEDFGIEVDEASENEESDEEFSSDEDESAETDEAEVLEESDAPAAAPRAVATAPVATASYDDLDELEKKAAGGSPLKAFLAGFVVVGLAILALRPAVPPADINREENRAREAHATAKPTGKSEVQAVATVPPVAAHSTNNSVNAANDNAVEVLPPGVESTAPVANAAANAATSAPAGDSAMALATAAQIGDNGEVQKLLDARADINAVDARGWTPLMNAAASGKLETVRLLLARSANANATAPDGQTALSLAMRGGNADIIKALQDAGAK